MKYPIWENDALGDIWSKVCTSFFYGSMALSADDGKGMVKLWGKIQQCLQCDCVQCC